MSQVVRYALDTGAIVSFEIDPPEGFEQAGTERLVGRVREAIGPAVEAAREVLDRVAGLGPQAVEVKFGLKVTGKLDWLVAKVATEGNFEVTLKWQQGPGEDTEASTP